MWLRWQVGVKAPGTATSTTLRPLNTSSVVFGFGPSGVITRKVAWGSVWPTWIVMVVSGNVDAGELAWQSRAVEARARLDGAIPGNQRETQLERPGAVARALEDFNWEPTVLDRL